MTTESPLYRMRIECPVCRNENDFLAIKVGSYTESGRDSDFRPTGRVWRNPEFQDTDPLYYSVATCSSCFYTRELDGNYKNWPKDKRFTWYRQKPLREAHLLALAEPDGALRALGGHLDFSRHPRPTTINRLLLGILDEQITEGGDRLNVARFYLRIAWLFRDLGVVGPALDSGSQKSDEVHTQIHELRELLESAHARTRRLASVMRELCGAQGDFEAQADLLARNGTGLLAEWEAAAGLERVPLPHLTPPTSTGLAYFEFSCHAAFLQHLKSRWQEVPQSEPEALDFALNHYKEYFERCRSFPSPELEVQTAYLIAEIARRVGRSRESFGYFNHAIRKGHELIHEYQDDPQRSGYLRKLVEMSVEQGKMNRDEQEIVAET